MLDACSLGRLLPGSHDESGRPSWRAAVAGRRNGVNTVAAAGEKPGREGVGVPHVTRCLLVPAPGAGREVRHEVQQTPGVLLVAAESLSASDGIRQIRDDAVTPAVDLVAEERRAAEDLESHGTDGDHAAVPRRQPPPWSHFDHVSSSDDKDLEGRVIERAALAMMVPCRDRLVQAPTPAHEARGFASAEWEPEQIDVGRRQRVTHRQSLAGSSAGTGAYSKTRRALTVPERTSAMASLTSSMARVSVTTRVRPAAWRAKTSVRS